MKSASQTFLASLNVRSWFLATRPRTWIASISPVLIGASLVEQPLYWGLFSMALLFALSLQIASNFANDYFDFINGADGPNRKGPARAAQMGWITPSSLRLAALWMLTFSCAIGFYFALYIGLWILPIILCAALAAWYYTGGKKPLGYLGLGELLVFPFFGPIAVIGTYYLQTFEAPFSVWIASIPPGLLSCAILAANNLRDYNEDRAAGKHTLVVRYGLLFGKCEYVLLVLTAILLGGYATLWLLPIALAYSVLAIKKAQHPALLPGTALLLLLYTVLSLEFGLNFG